MSVVSCVTTGSEWCNLLTLSRFILAGVTRIGSSDGRRQGDLAFFDRPIGAGGEPFPCTCSR